MGTLAIMGFDAEDNLRQVALALAQRNRGALALVEERNAKQSRLRVEVEEQIVEESAHLQPNVRQLQKWRLASQAANLFEHMGQQTVEIASSCDKILREPRPVRVADVRKLLEHAVYITDRAATGLVEEDLDMARVAREQKYAADELNMRVGRDLARLTAERGDAVPSIDLLRQIASKAHGLIEAAGRLADDVIGLLEGAGV